MFIFAVVVLILDDRNIHLKLGISGWFGFTIITVLIIALFCQAGLTVDQEDYRKHFNWLVFAIALIAAAALFTIIARKTVKARQASVFGKM